MAIEEPTFTREPPSLMLKLMLKVPVFLYHGWLAEVLGWRCVMLLTTTGRRTGLPRTTGVSFLRAGNRFVAFSGWGIRSHWYHNLLANPEVIIQVGRRRLHATACPVMDPHRRQQLMLRMRDRSQRCGPPPVVRPLLHYTRIFDYEREIAMAVEHARELPVVEFIPHTEI